MVLNWPLDRPADAFTLPLALGALVFSALQAVRWIVSSVRARSRPSANVLFDEMAGSPPGIGGRIFAILASAAGGGITMLCLVGAANAWVCETPPREEPVTA